MSFLGICRETGAIYGGTSSSNGHRLQPTPVLLPVTVVTDDHNPHAPADGTFLPDTLFCEHDFDPIARIRRGTVFSRRHQGPQPQSWSVQDPIRQDLPRMGVGGGMGATWGQKISLTTYQSDNLEDLRGKSPRSLPLVALGESPFRTLWRPLAVEHLATGGDLLTLRAHRWLTLLPHLIDEAVPLEVVGSLQSAMEKVEDSVDRLGPVAVVDRCRDALAIVFGTKAGDPTLDLMCAINRAEKGNTESMLRAAGLIVARLHSRGKPNEQFARDVRPPSEEDAHLALECLRLVLVENGWAR